MATIVICVFLPGNIQVMSTWRQPTELVGSLVLKSKANRVLIFLECVCIRKISTQTEMPQQSMCFAFKKSKIQSLVKVSEEVGVGRPPSLPEEPISADHTR